MNVGDLVTLSAAGLKTDKIIDQHKRYFKGPNSGYYTLAPEDRERFNAYWNPPDDKNKVIGLITRIEERHRSHYSYEEGRYVMEPTGHNYWVAWQANPKPLGSDAHIRSHLKFVKKGKKNA